MIDCHCHLTDNAFNPDRDKVLQRAKQAGVEGVVVVSEFYDQPQKVLRLAEEHRGMVWAGIGVHPIQKRNKNVQLRHLDALKVLKDNADDVVCMGEIGLDFSPRYKLTDEEKAVQLEVFRGQLELAVQFGLPVNVHSRGASMETLSVLSSFPLPVLLHAFDGPSPLVEEAVARGFFLSLPPSFTLSSQGLLLVDRVPLTQLVLESDSPALGLEKGRNEPLSIEASARFIALHKGIPLEEIVNETTANAKKLFPRLNRPPKSSP